MYPLIVYKNPTTISTYCAHAEQMEILCFSFAISLVIFLWTNFSCTILIHAETINDWCQISFGTLETRGPISKKLMRIEMMVK